MVKIIKELKPFTVLVLIIVGLLFAQAMADLALPDYMSNIVNVGIQQNGIENAVPQVIRAEKMEKLKILLDEEEKNIVNKNYKLIDKSNLTEQEFKDYSKKI